MVGLVVIVIVIVYALIARVVVRFFTDDINPKSRGSTWRLVGYAIAAILPFADAFYGSARLAIACAVHTKAELFSPLDVPEKFVLENKRSLVDDYGSIRWKNFVGYLKESRTESREWFSTVRRVTTEIATVRDNRKVGVQVDFYFKGGWLPWGSTERGAGAGFCQPKTTLEDLVKASLKLN